MRSFKSTVNGITDWLFGFMVFIIMIMLCLWAWTWAPVYSVPFYIGFAIYLGFALEHYTNPKNMNADYVSQYTNPPTLHELELAEWDRRYNESRRDRGMEPDDFDFN